ncbi:PIN domain-containing protein [Sphingomonas lenta]|uniref:VapC toxin family PIN domain ribonuclease n=1 Tax=Sphingomonas lenta TaxID=1141887 RepID=A0A2A2SBI7_9SPHN|nr:PIN domain-containing protein [Sphingomonas lenta]PAX06617.1 VapC toxin family PIN domain ribonuclease [Sphingomonas lenta]
MTRAFFDSNILVYAFTNDDARQERALELLAIGGTISVQCLNEFASVTRRKLGMDWKRIHTALEEIRDLCRTIMPLDLDTHIRGIELVQHYKLSVYDGMIVAAALAADCDTLYSEDMHAGLVVNGRLTVVNPFAP